MPRYTAPRFAILICEKSCWKCQSPTKVGAVMLDCYIEDDEGEVLQVDDRVLLTSIEVLNPEALAELQRTLPAMRYGYSQTAEHSYLANHCTACDALQGAWYLMKPDAAFFATSEEAARRVQMIWIAARFEAVDQGGSVGGYLDYFTERGAS